MQGQQEKQDNLGIKISMQQRILGSKQEIFGSFVMRSFSKEMENASGYWRYGLKCNVQTC